MGDAWSTCAREVSEEWTRDGRLRVHPDDTSGNDELAFWAEVEARVHAADTMVKLHEADPTFMDWVGKPMTANGKVVGEIVEAGFNPSQQRDATGKWAASGGGKEPEKKVGPVKPTGGNVRALHLTRREQVALATEMSRSLSQDSADPEHAENLIRRFDRFLGHRSTAQERLDFRYRMAYGKVQDALGDLLDVRNTGNPAVRATVTQLGVLDRRVLALLKLKGTRVVIGRDPEEIFDTSNWGPPPGAYGGGWSDVQALYSDEANVLVVQGTDARMTTVVAHEAGHAIDFLTDRPSQTDEWAEITKEAALIDGNPYFTPEGQNGSQERAQSEWFAECFAQFIESGGLTNRYAAGSAPYKLALRIDRLMARALR